MLKKITKYIERNSLLARGARVLVALSGGADSVALLAILHKLGYECHSVHCNFHLRGAESMRDEQFVRALCRSLGVPLSVADFDTEAYATEHGISIEMAARELRYAFFEQKRQETAAEAVAVAHHRNDSAETLLLNLIRGTGIRGLHGIRPRNGHIVRPLLCVGRDDILNFLEQEGLTYVTDSTNLTTDYTRNKIRLELLPLMGCINPSIIDSLVRTAENIAEAEQLYNCAVEQAIGRIKEGNEISIPRLLAEPAPRTLLHEILSPLGFNKAQTDDIYNALGTDGGKIFNSDAWSVVKNRDRLLLVDSGRLQRDIDKDIFAELTFETYPFDGKIERSPLVAMLDADKIEQPLRLRGVRAGDRFVPFGMRGSKLVSDYLTDKKRSLVQKRQQRVLVDAGDNIVWLVGERPAAPYCVGESTVSVLKITWNKRD